MNLVWGLGPNWRLKMIKLLEKFGKVEMQESGNPDYLAFYFVDLGDLVTLRIAHTKKERLEMVLFSPEEMYRGARLTKNWMQSNKVATISATRSEKTIENAIAKYITTNEGEISDLAQRRKLDRQYVDTSIESTLAAHLVLGMYNMTDEEAYEISQSRMNRQTMNTMAMDGAHFNKPRAYVAATQGGENISIMFDDLTPKQAREIYQFWKEYKGH